MPVNRFERTKVVAFSAVTIINFLPGSLSRLEYHLLLKIAFVFLHTTKQSRATLAVLYNDALPLYQGGYLPVSAIQTDNGGRFNKPYPYSLKLYLEDKDIEHRRTEDHQPYPNGFLERFRRTVLDEFYRTAFRTKLYETVEALHDDLDAWLHYYNNEPSHHDHWNRGKRRSTH